MIFDASQVKSRKSQGKFNLITDNSKIITDNELSNTGIIEDGNFCDKYR